MWPYWICDFDRMLNIMSLFLLIKTEYKSLGKHTKGRIFWIRDLGIGRKGAENADGLCTGSPKVMFSVT